MVAQRIEIESNRGSNFLFGNCLFGTFYLCVFVLPKPDDSELLEAFKKLVFILLPLLSAWMIYISIVMWFYSKQLKSE
jgi:hypothetical protein